MKRRPNNTGSTYELPNRKRKYGAQISIHGRRISRSFETKVAREEWLKRALEDKTKILEDFTLVDYLTYWLELRNPYQSTSAGNNQKKSSAQLHGITLLSPNTYILYKRTIDNHILPVLEHRKRLKLSEVKTEDIEAILVASMVEAKVRRTTQVTRRVLSKALRDAITLKLRTNSNVAAELLTPYESPERKPPTNEEFNKLVKAAQGTRLENLIPFAGVTGMRRGELAGAKWADIDYARSVLRIERQSQRLPVNGKAVIQKTNRLGVGSANIFRKPKTKSSVREIPLGWRALELLDRQKERLEKERQVALKRKRGWQEMDLIFPSSVGTPMEPTTLRRDFKKLLKAVDLRGDIHFHDLRHFSVTMLASKKIRANSKSIGKRTGQKDERVMLLYTHAIDEEDYQIAEDLEKMLLSDLEAMPKIRKVKKRYQGRKFQQKPGKNDLQQNCRQ